VSGKWWLLRAGGAGEPGEAAEGHGAAGKVHISRTRQNKWAKIGPLSPFSSCPRISQSGQGARAALWAALWPDSAWPPFGRARAALRAATCPEGRPGGPVGRPSGRPFFEGRPERRPFFCKSRPHFEGGRPVGGPSAMVAARSETAGRPSVRRAAPFGPPDFGGWPPTFFWRAARIGPEGRPIWRLGGPGGGRAARSPVRADSTTYRPPVPRVSVKKPQEAASAVEPSLTQCTASGQC